MRLYRIIVRTTGSVQPGSGSTFWNREVVYCGYDRAEAIRLYHANAPLDYGGAPGNRARRTVSQSKDVTVEA